MAGGGRWCWLPRKGPHCALHNGGFAALLLARTSDLLCIHQAIQNEGQGCPLVELGNWRWPSGPLPLGSAHHAASFEGGFKVSPGKASWILVSSTNRGWGGASPGGRQESAHQSRRNRTCCLQNTAVKRVSGWALLGSRLLCPQQALGADALCSLFYIVKSVDVADCLPVWSCPEDTTREGKMW